MRISDWSSDVCSSDLLEPHRAARRQPFGGDAEAVARNIEQPRLDALLAERAHTDARAGRPPPRAALFGNLADRRFETHSLSPRACVPTKRSIAIAKATLRRVRCRHRPGCAPL